MKLDEDEANAVEAYVRIFHCLKDLYARLMHV